MDRKRYGFSDRLSNERGSMLLETILAMFILSVAGLVLIGFVQKTIVVSFKAREQTSCSRLLQTGFARIRNTDFYYIFNSDSAQTDHGLQSSYPYKAMLNDLSGTLTAAKFTRFRIQVAFLRRDTSDANNNGMTGDLIEFTDADADLVDDYDAGIRYFDQNDDEDYYDTYTSGGRIVAEQPDTHIKRVTLEIYRRERLACSQTENVSLEQFTGQTNPSSEAVLKLLATAPTNSSYLYQLDTSAQQDAWNLAISKTYPATVQQYRADLTSWLQIAGETDPLATVRLYVDLSAELANTAADVVGSFDTSPLAVTQALVEGGNILRAQATKDSYTSPILQRGFILDSAPPVLDGDTPTGTIATLSPYVAVTLSDAGVSTTVTSGICPDVVTMRVDGTEVATSLDSGLLVWIDSTTQGPPILSSQTYTVEVEAGDYAGYKASTTWTFTLSVPAVDNSAPSISQPSPSGMAGSQLPVISAKLQDNQSGIDYRTIIMKVDGSTVVSSGNAGTAFDPLSELVSYTPSASFVSGSFHTVEVTVNHWATSPADKVTSSQFWGFSVP